MSASSIIGGIEKEAHSSVTSSPEKKTLPETGGANNGQAFPISTQWPIPQGGNPIVKTGTSILSNNSVDGSGCPSTVSTLTPLLPKREHPFSAQFLFQTANGIPNDLSLFFSFPQSQQSFLHHGLPTTTNNAAFWNSFSVIGNSKIEPFPERLHRLLTEVEASGRSDIISWVHGGRGFEIHKSEEFFRDIVPNYFKHSKLASFKRQLGLYGFQLYTPDHVKGGSGAVKGYYAHKDFRKDMPDLCRRMRRQNRQGMAASGKSTKMVDDTKESNDTKEMLEKHRRVQAA